MMNETYCTLCKRQFGSQSALSMHVRNAKVHKNEARRHISYVQPQEISPSHTRLPSLSSVPLNTEPLAQNVDQGHIVLAPASDTNIEQSSMNIGGYCIDWPNSGMTRQTRSEPAFPLQTSTALQYQFQNSEMSVAELALSLPPSSVLTNGSPSFSSFQQPMNSARPTFKYGNNYWSGIPISEYALTVAELSRNCHTVDDLQKSRYILSPNGADAISALRKCKNCHGLQKKLDGWTRSECLFHPGRLHIQDPSGGVRQYSCCGRSGRGCVSLPGHAYGNTDNRRLVTKYQTFAPTPPSNNQASRFRAVALDCEMAGVQGGSSELILLCAVDFLSGACLINTLVEPTERVIDWRSRYSGVTRQAMAAATAQGQTLKGWKAARAALWKCIDADTILVGQSLQHDLDVLRMIHFRVVDAGILARDAVGPGVTRQWGLKTLCQELLDIEIQNDKKGHDCMEDTLAAREVVLWCIQRPDELADWGLVKNEEEQRRQRERLEKARKKSEEAKREREESERTKKESLERRAYFDHPSDGNEDDVLHWSDIAEDCGWPHPDTGYDPWSD